MPDTHRDQVVRHACRQIGVVMNSFMTGDPGADDIAEYLARGWLISEDRLMDDDFPLSTSQITTSLVGALRRQGEALVRLADELDRGDLTLNSLDGVELPALSPVPTR